MKSFVVRLLTLAMLLAIFSSTTYSQCTTGRAYMTMYYPYGGQVTQGSTLYHYWYIPTTVSGSTISVQWSPDKTNWTTVASGFACTRGYYYEYITAPYDFEATTTCYARIVEVSSSGSCYYYPAYSYSYRYNNPFKVIRICRDPQITKQPESQVVCVNQAVTLEVGAPTGKHFSYKWFKDGFPTSTDGPNLEFPSITLKDNGTYQLEVSDDCGRKTLTQKATITVYEPAAVTKQPVSMTVCKGTSGKFIVECSGNANTYQWYKNGSPITGETTTTLRFPSALPTDEGQYHLVATGGCGAPAVTDIVTITVPPKPDIVEQPQPTVVCPNETIHLSITASGPNLTYQWFKDDEAILGANAPVLDIAMAGESNNGFYHCVVDIPGVIEATGCMASVKSDRVFVYAYAAPVIRSQPESQQLCVGSNGSLAVGTDGTDLSYQWYHNGSAVENATNYTMDFASATPSDAGSYYAVITGACGLSVTSGTVTVDVLALPVITMHPENVSTRVGEPFTLSIEATDAQHVSWLRNEQEIESDGTTTLSIPAATLEHNGYYRAVVRNVCGGATSKLVRVIVIDPRTLEPRLTTSMTTLDVQEVPYGYSSNQTFTGVVTNTGIVPVTISGMNVSGPDAAAFTAVESVAPTTLQPGEDLSIVVGFTPAHLESSNATLTIESDATNGPHTFTLAGTGVVRYTVSGDLAFGVVDKSSTTTKCFQINNTSNVEIAIDQVELAGQSPTDFSVSTAMPVTVAAGSTKELCLQFMPVDVGEYAATVSFKSSTGGNSEATTSGTCEIAATVTLDALEAGIVAFPNPATETLNIATGSVIPTSISVLTLSGQLVTTLQPATNTAWNLVAEGGNSVPSGTYIVVIADATHQYRMMVQVTR